MDDPLSWAILLGTALVASVIAGVAGFGAGILLLPVLVSVLGVRAAVPVLTVTMLLGNLSRIWWSRREIDRAVAARFLVGAAPATALGAALFAAAPGDTLRVVIGAFLLASSPLRRLLASDRLGVRLAHFPLIGAASGVLSAVVVTTGPVMTPFFLGYGLRRGAYIASEAVCTLGMHVVRGAVLTGYRLVTPDVLLVGVSLGLVMFAGAWVGRRLLDRVSDRAFLVGLETLVALLGLHMLLT